MVLLSQKLLAPAELTRTPQALFVRNPSALSKWSLGRSLVTLAAVYQSD